MNTYTLYVGSTDYFDAHTATAHADAFPPLAFYRENVTSENGHGVWDNRIEDTLILTVDLPGDSTAQHIAYAIGRFTGNECVMVTREAPEADSAFNSVRPYRVTRESRSQGNRTLGNWPHDGSGWAFERDSRGEEIAYLVWADGSVTGVE